MPGGIYYRCTKSRGGAKSCSQRYLREETLEAQLTEQLGAVEIPDKAMALVRSALRDLHGKEKEFRDSAITSLRRRQDEIQKKQDVLLDRLLDGTVGEQVYHAKHTALQNERAEILIEQESHERANERYFDETETLLSFANRLGEIFAKGSSGTKMTALKLVASNAMLEGRNARLNLRPAFAVLAKTGPHTKWLPIIKDVRTAFAADPLPL